MHTSAMRFNTTELTRRDFIKNETGARETRETPKSRWTTKRPSHFQYCTKKGRSSPYSARSDAICSEENALSAFETEDEGALCALDMICCVIIRSTISPGASAIRANIERPSKKRRTSIVIKRALIYDASGKAFRKRLHGNESEPNAAAIILLILILSVLRITVSYCLKKT